MLAKDRVAIVRFVPRTSSQVKFAALLPQAEAYDEDNFQTPPGFNLVFLPFADDVRKLATVKPTEKTPVDRNQVINAKLLIKSLTTEFDARNFENPDLQTFYANLQTIALGEDEPEEVEDLLEPDVEGMEKYANVTEAFKESIWGGDYADPDEGGAPAPKSRGKAKKDDDDDGGNTTKRTKKTVEKADKDDDDIDSDMPKKKGGRGGGRGKKKDEDEDEYDYDDGFIVDDRKGSKGRGKKSSSVKKEEMEEEEDSIEKLLREGEVNY